MKDLYKPMLNIFNIKEALLLILQDGGKNPAISAGCVYIAGIRVKYRQQQMLDAANAVW